MMKFNFNADFCEVAKRLGKEKKPLNRTLRLEEIRKHKEKSLQRGKDEDSHRSTGKV
jgi:hypothetical protein